MKQRYCVVQGLRVRIDKPLEGAQVYHVDPFTNGRLCNDPEKMELPFHPSWMKVDTPIAPSKITEMFMSRKAIDD